MKKWLCLMLCLCVMLSMTPVALMEESIMDAAADVAVEVAEAAEAAEPAEVGYDGEVTAEPLEASVEEVASELAEAPVEEDAAFELGGEEAEEVFELPAPESEGELEALPEEALFDADKAADLSDYELIGKGEDVTPIEAQDGQLCVEFVSDWTHYSTGMQVGDHVDVVWGDEVKEIYNVTSSNDKVVSVYTNKDGSDVTSVSLYARNPGEASVSIFSFGKNFYSGCIEIIITVQEDGESHFYIERDYPYSVEEDSTTYRPRGYDMCVGLTQNINVVTFPSDLALDLEWSSSKPSVIQVDQDGGIRAVGRGTATITATDTISGKYDCITLTVGNPPQSMDFQVLEDEEPVDRLVVRHGWNSADYWFLLVTFYDGDGNEVYDSLPCTISISNPELAEIETGMNMGHMYAKKGSGSATITAECMGMTASREVYFVDTYDPPARVEMWIEDLDGNPTTSLPYFPPNAPDPNEDVNSDGYYHTQINLACYDSSDIETPEYLDFNTPKYTFSNPSVAEIAYGSTLRTLATGKTTLTVDCGGTKASLDIEVVDSMPTSLVLRGPDDDNHYLYYRSYTEDGETYEEFSPYYLNYDAYNASGDHISTPLKWTTSNAKIATVTSDGDVEAHGLGSVRITATSVTNPSLSAYVDLTVVKPGTPVSMYIIGQPDDFDEANTLSLYTDGDDGEIIKNIWYDLGIDWRGAVDDNAVSSANTTWKSSNPKVAVVETVTVDGEKRVALKAVSAGTTTITATSTDNKALTDSFELRVVDERTPAEIRISVSRPLYLYYEDRNTFSRYDVDAYAANAVGDELETPILWKSSNPGVVSVEEGHLEAHSQGTATITVYSQLNEAVNDTFEVIVVGYHTTLELFISNLPEDLDVPGTMLLYGDGEDGAGNRVKNEFSDLGWYLQGAEDAEPKTELDWSSSNPNVATVTMIDDGNGESMPMLTAVSAGETTITAVSRDNPKARDSFVLTVLDDQKPVKVADINATTFPDPVFRQFVLDEIDTDGNQVLTNLEAHRAVEFGLADKNIASLEGLQYFKNLKSLDCQGNSGLKTLDVSNNTNLFSLNANKCNLDSLNVSRNSAMTYLLVENNPRLKSIDISACPKLIKAWTKGSRYVNDEDGHVFASDGYNACIRVHQSVQILYQQAEPASVKLLTPATTTLYITVNASSSLVLEAQALSKTKEVIPGIVFDWTSSNNNVASVNDGVVTPGFEAGSVTITATAAGTKLSASVTLTVVDTTVPKAIAITGRPGSDTLVIEAGKDSTHQLGYALTSVSGAGYEAVAEVEWTSKDESVATVDGSGLVTARAEGKTEITATALRGKDVRASFTLQVIDHNKPVKLTIGDRPENDRLYLNVGQAWAEADLAAEALNAANEPVDAAITWAVSGKNAGTVATVDKDGHVKAVGVGQVVVTASANSNPKAAVNSFTLTVVDPTVATDIRILDIDESERTLLVNTPDPGEATIDLKDYLQPVGAYPEFEDFVKLPALTWKSSKTASATVTNGVVTGKAPIDAVVITLSVSKPKISKTITLKVADPTLPVAIAFDQEDDSWKTLKINTGKPADATLDLKEAGRMILTGASDQYAPKLPACTWKAAPSSIATVKDGVVTAKKAGDVTVTVTTKTKPVLSASVKLKVADPSIPEKLEFVGLDETPIVLRYNTDDASVNLLDYLYAENVDGETIDAKLLQLNWKSGKSSNASVNKSGVVTAKKVGEGIRITVSTKAKPVRTAEVMVNVVDPTIPDRLWFEGIDVKTLYLNTSDNTLNLANYLHAKNVDGETIDVSRLQLTWKSGKSSIASVDKSGLVTAKKAGEDIRITVSTKTKQTAEVTLNVVDPTVPKAWRFEVPEEKKTLYVGAANNTLNLKALIGMEAETAEYAAKLPDIAWKSSKATFASVDKNGIVTPKSEGKVTITATAKKTGLPALTVELNIVDPSMPRQIFVEQGSKLWLSPGQTCQLVWEVRAMEGYQPKNTAVTWKSSDTKVVTVSNKGLVTAKDMGDAVIKGTTKNGVAVEIKVSVAGE